MQGLFILRLLEQVWTREHRRRRTSRRSPRPLIEKNVRSASPAMPWPRSVFAFPVHPPGARRRDCGRRAAVISWGSLGTRRFPSPLPWLPRCRHVVERALVCSLLRNLARDLPKFPSMPPAPALLAELTEDKTTQGDQHIHGTTPARAASKAVGVLNGDLESYWPRFLVRATLTKKRLTATGW